MIAVNNLRKKYGEIDALTGVSFRVQVREIYGLLGPNAGLGRSQPRRGTRRPMKCNPPRVRCVLLTRRP